MNRLSKLERLILALLIGGGMLWIAWQDIGEGVAPPSSWPWGLLAAAGMAWLVWRMAGGDLPDWWR